MKIASIAPYQPFSKAQDGVTLLLCPSGQKLTIYPTAIDLGNGVIKSLAITGPVQDFLVKYELEKASIMVSGRAKEGYFAYRIIENNKVATFISLKDPCGAFDNFEKKVVKSLNSSYFERMTLGKSRLQEVDRIHKDRNFLEILPLLFAMGQLFTNEIPSLESQPGSFEELQNLYLYAFTSFFTPKINPYLGVYYPLDQSRLGPGFLKEMSLLIRGLFIREEGENIFLLSQLFKPFAYGRMNHLKMLEGKLEISMQWSRGEPLKILLKAYEDISFGMIFKESITGFRVTWLHNKEKFLGNKCHLHLKAHDLVYIDQFKH